MAGSSGRVIFAWSLYDWANSAFATLVVTFVYATYFTQAIAADEVVGTELWSRAIALSGLTVAVLAPFLGSMADNGGHRRGFLIVASAVCIVSTAALAFVAPGDASAVLLALALVVVANTAFEIGLVFYNAFLPDIADPARIGKVSGYGWALGYVGGIGCLVVALAVLVREVPLFGISTEAGFNYRATNLLVAAWFLVFSLPMLIGVKPVQRPPRPIGLRDTVAALSATVTKMRAYREVVRFLVARLFYNDGLVTVFAFGGIYAAGTFGMTLTEVIQFGVVINVAAGVGALLFGFVDDRIGGRLTVLLTLVALSGFTTLAVLAPDKTWLWVAAVGIGIFVGPNQSASRSLMARFVPPGHQTEFFGFFAFSGKITTFMGPFLLGVVTAWSGSQRVGVATVIIFFVIGGLLLLTVDERAGIDAAKADPTGAPSGSAPSGSSLDI